MKNNGEKFPLFFPREWRLQLCHVLNFKQTVMKNIRVELVSVLASDKKVLTAMQQKINQWITIGKLKKYEIHTAGEHIIFNIAMLKDTEEPPF